MTGEPLHKLHLCSIRKGFKLLPENFLCFQLHTQLQYFEGEVIMVHTLLTTLKFTVLSCKRSPGQIYASCIPRKNSNTETNTCISLLPLIDLLVCMRSIGVYQSNRAISVYQSNRSIGVQLLVHCVYQCVLVYKSITSSVGASGKFKQSSAMWQHILLLHTRVHSLIPVSGRDLAE